MRTDITRNTYYSYTLFYSLSIYYLQESKKLFHKITTFMETLFMTTALNYIIVDSSSLGNLF